MKNLFLISLILICSYVAPARADISPEKRAEIEKLLRLGGTEKLMNQIKEQMISAFKEQFTGLPADFWNKFNQKMDVRELIEKIIPIYDKYYTVDDLKAVNAFYESPAGQKLLSSLPQVTHESMKIGQAWGERIGAQVAAEVQQEKNHQPIQ